jgi:mannose-6-phosphate isomerase
MVMGHSTSLNGRFPLLVKILDAQETLSVQVHPPADKAAILGGEPKTEMWFITEASRGASLFVGLKNGVSKDHFIESINHGTVADCLFSHDVKAGDCMFLPSGRLHAIGAGNVIFEIQQNSDTTYRVFDWNRAGLDGKPRELHIKESIESIDFKDFEPPLASFDITSNLLPDAMRIVDNELFKVDHANWPEGFQFELPHLDRPIVLGIHRGQLAIGSNNHTVNLRPGEFVLIPAACRMIRMTAVSESAQFIVSIPQ